MKKWILLAAASGVVVVLAVWLAIWAKPEEVPFRVIEQGYSLVSPSGFPRPEPEPSLIILASPEEMRLVQPYTFPEPLAKTIEQVDFQKYFVILAIRVRTQGGVITNVTRRSASVVITTTDLMVGPGNYVMEEWTWPYQVALIEKTSAWGQEVRFFLKRETQGTAGEAIHFIP